MVRIQKTVSPVDGSTYVERPTAEDNQIAQAIERAVKAQGSWRQLSPPARAEQLTAFVDTMMKHTDDIAEELTWQMGRPIGQSPGELRGFEERARHMISIGPEALADVQVAKEQGFTRYIKRAPLGVVFVVAPWNFPFLTAVNSVVPALMAGNAVIIKHSSQTPLVAERFSSAAKEAGLPSGVLQHLHLDHDQVARVVEDPAVGFVAFTGSVGGGHAVQRAAASRFIATGLELGGKDPGYVRPDANLQHAIDTLVDGAFFNSGQSCCGIERIYVHREVYKPFVEGCASLTEKYHLGNPTDPATNLGPMVRTGAADFVRKQIASALAGGAKPLIDESSFAASKQGTAYLAPQILVDLDHSFEVMREETFGPVVGIMQVDSDEQAIQLMNDSPYGLTACVFTQDLDVAQRIGDQVDTGTWFMNRCDYLDPALAWTGVKNSGRGCTLSKLGYEALTRPKSYHLKDSPQ